MKILSEMVAYPILGSILFIITMIFIWILYKRKPDKPRIWLYPIYGSIILYFLLLAISLPDELGLMASMYIVSLGIYALFLIVCFCFVIILEEKAKRKNKDDRAD
jgi:Ca2+/Na+ antiporter